MTHGQLKAAYEQELTQLLRVYNPEKTALARLQKHPIDRQIAILQLVRAVQIALEAARRRAGGTRQIH